MPVLGVYKDCFLKGISLLAVVSLSQLSGRSSNINSSQIAFAIKLKIKKTQQ